MSAGEAWARRNTSGSGFSPLESERREFEGFEGKTRLERDKTHGARASARGRPRLMTGGPGRRGRVTARRAGACEDERDAPTTVSRCAPQGAAWPRWDASSCRTSGNDQRDCSHAGVLFGGVDVLGEQDTRAARRVGGGVVGPCLCTTVLLCCWDRQRRATL